MEQPPRSTRPPPRTPAAVEAELRRRVRTELDEARAAADGELTDVALAGVIAHAIGQALAWHLDAPEHGRGPSTSSGWRPAPGPRGRPRPDFDDRDRGPRPSGFRPSFGDRPAPSGNRRPPRPSKGGYPKPRRPR
jgi:hypothetical protein